MDSRVQKIPHKDFHPCDKVEVKAHYHNLAEMEEKDHYAAVKFKRGIEMIINGVYELKRKEAAS